MSDAIPLPKDPRHQRFADLVLSGMRAPDAYRKAGFKAATAGARSAAASRMLKSVNVCAYMDAVRQQSAKSTVLSVTEKREFLARVMRANLFEIDPNDPNHKDGDLVMKYKRTETEDGIREEIVRLCPIKAIAEDNKLSGDDPEANALQQMAEAFQRLGEAAGTLPVDRM